jgi:hypothetical protein
MTRTSYDHCGDNSNSNNINIHKIVVETAASAVSSLNHRLSPVTFVTIIPWYSRPHKEVMLHRQQIYHLPLLPYLLSAFPTDRHHSNPHQWHQ